MSHLLVTNDFPPQVGGIQSYLWELWRRLPPGDVTVLTTPHPDSAGWDSQQSFRIERTRQRVLLPSPSLRAQIDRLAAEVCASLVLLDPALPLGALGPRLERPYGVVLHGAEVAIPGHIPVVRSLLGRVLRGADLVVAAGGYPASEGDRAAGLKLPTAVIPPGVDVERFHPISVGERAAARDRFGVDHDATVVLGLSRLVPRKGFDVLVRAVSRLAATRPDLHLVIAGSGRSRERLEKLAHRHRAPVTFLGSVADEDVARLHGCVDVFAVVCRNRWFGLEQEGFGIVFLEAAACGVPQVAGSSGGAGEAVVDGVTGAVVTNPRSIPEVVTRLGALVDHPSRRERLAVAGRNRVVAEFTYDALARKLAEAIEAV